MNKATFHHGVSRGVILLLVCLAAFPTLAQDSPHGELEHACDRCHTASAWNELARPLRFNHSTTGFPLEGQHSKVYCLSCHASLRFTEAPAECRDCHDDVHRGELGLECARCHGPETWLVPDMPQRHGGTRFPLLGAHLATACQPCHPNQQQNEFVRTPTDCFSCHSRDYQATMAPAHAPSGIGTNCEACHSVSDLRWEGTFNHSLTAFPLSGAHRAVACAECHRAGRFTGTPAQCSSCHLEAYAETTSPAHAASGFPLECQSCHSTQAWEPSTFNHEPLFPIASGPHSPGRWSDCSDCHTVASNFSSFSCLTCHEHDQIRMDEKHAKISGYLYQSQSCYQCHPRGRDG